MLTVLSSVTQRTFARHLSIQHTLAVPVTLPRPTRFRVHTFHLNVTRVRPERRRTVHYFRNRWMEGFWRQANAGADFLH